MTRTTTLTDPITVATTAVHVALGFFEDNDPALTTAAKVAHKLGATPTMQIKWLTDDESDKLGGQIGGSALCAETALLLMRIMETLSKWDIEWPGVFDYEISEPVGTRLRITSNPLGITDAEWLTDYLEGFLKTKGLHPLNENLTRNDILSAVCEAITT